MHSPDPVAAPLDHLLLRGRPGDIALKAGKVIFSYAALEDQVARLAAALHAMGVGPGDRLACWLPKTALACMMPLAAARAGAVYVPINPLLKAGQVAHILEDSGAAALITDAAHRALMPASTPLSACPVIYDRDLLAAAQRLCGLPPSIRDPQQLCQLLYTSGSTGLPKGVMLSHANIWLGAASVAHYLGLDRDDRTLAALPLSFDYGQSQLLSTWYAGGRVVPMSTLWPRAVITHVADEGITTLAGVPTFWRQVLRSRVDFGALRALKRVTNSGGALDATLVQALRHRLPDAAIFAMYGLTEAFRATFLAPELIDDHPTSIGTAIPFAEVMVVRPDGTPAAMGEIGELVQAGPLVAQGYWHQPEAMAARFRPAPDWSALGGMAVWSGDLVTRDAQGLLYFEGRGDDLIKTAGYRVSPTEIESLALAHPAVALAMACGVPDAERGQAIHLVMTGHAAQHQAVLRHLQQGLPHFMQPQRLIWLDAMPLTANGKPDRAALRRIAEAMA